MKKQFPDILLPQIKMTLPNEKLTFHEGNFTINWKGYEFKLYGKIVFAWSPTLESLILLSGFDHTLFKPLESAILVEIKSSNPVFKCKGIISRIHSLEEYNLICLLSPPIEFGNCKLLFDYARFEIANLRDIEGIPVKSHDTGYKNRLILIDDDSKIIIDKYPDYIFLKQKLTESNGFQLLYTGRLELKNRKKISYEQIQEKLEALSIFLTFVNGSTISPLFRYGFIGNSVAWKSSTPYINDSYSYVYSWVTNQENNGLPNLWKNFNMLWQNQNDQECIKIIINWYTIANQNKALIEGSIVLIQNALELLFHWLIAEKYNYMTSTDADNISATSKIGFLLSHYNISPEIPEEFRGLTKYSKQNNITNGPEAFTRIRNCIVHPSRKKRKTLKELENNSKVESLHLGLWYVELILLKHLNFKGEYLNRCKQLKLYNPYEKIN